MANQNLSQFTEKTFVADADWVFVWDTAGAISKKVSRNNWLNSGTLAGASAPITVSQTWNDAAVAFTALKVNAVSTASASGSLLLDLQVGGVSQFSVDKDGKTSTIILQAPSFRLGSGSGFAFSDISTTTWRLGLSSSFTEGQIFSAGSNMALSLTANVIEARNSTNAQTFNVYGTYSTSPSLAYSRLAIACDTSGNATLTTQSTGTAGTVSINGVPVGLGKGNISSNVAIGPLALSNNSTGDFQVAVGRATLTSNTSGNWNTAIGNGASFSNTVGTKNVSVGESSLLNNTTGSLNTALGHLAGASISSGNNIITNSSVFLGALTKANASGETNQIVIGYDATGLGSNTAVLGNASITTTALRGNVGIGTTAPAANLEVFQPTTGVGTISVGAGGTTITGVGTQFTNTFKLGDTITSAGQTLTVGAISSDTVMTCGAAGAAITSQPYTLVGGSRLSVSGAGDMVLRSGRTTQLRIISNTGTNVFNGLTIETSSTLAGFQVNTNSGEVKIGALSNGGYFPTFYSNNVEVMRISTAGNVGIGTTAPSSKLQVTGGDVEIETVTSGIIMKAAGTSTRYRITLNAGGTALVFTAV